MKKMALRVALLFGAAALVVAAAGCGGGGSSSSGGGGGKGGTLVFAGASDPVVLDGALVSDGESIRVIQQIFDGLVSLKPGTTEIQPALAESWDASPDGKTWTFHLRDGVTFHDGTDFNAAAVCTNFDRWYNFKGSFQNSSATYYWQTVFGGFKKNEPENKSLGGSLFASCTAQDDKTAVIKLTKPSASFLGALSLSSFGIASPKALADYGADQGKVDSDGVFHPTGTFGTEHPIGTGPFKFDSWTRGDKLTLDRYDDYWGEKAKIDKLIFRPIADNAARLQALQSGEIQGYDLVEPQDVDTIKGDSNLQILDRPAFNVGYVGINQDFKPFDNPKVRMALAYGLDRQAVVDSFYAGRGVVAKEFMPPEVVGYSDDVTEYTYDPAKAKQLLTEAGVSMPVKVDFWYPTDVSRPYMPDPKKNFEAFAASLNKSGFKVVPHSAPWSPDYLGKIDEGKTAVYLVGWTGDYGDADNFVGTFFQSEQKAWGTIDHPNKQVEKLLNDAEVETDAAKREDLYKQANKAISDWVPGVPYVHTKPALAFVASAKGYQPSPVGLELFNTVSIG